MVSIFGEDASAGFLPFQAGQILHGGVVPPFFGGAGDGFSSSNGFLAVCFPVGIDFGNPFLRVALGGHGNDRLVKA
jgi:hypothetical protein